MATMKTRPTLGPRELTLWLKIVAAVLALIPAGILLLAGASSVLGSDGDGFGLLGWLIVAPLVILTVVGWLRPYLGGLILVGGSVFLAVAAIVLLVWDGESLSSIVTAGLAALLMFVVPPLLGGTLFVLVSRVDTGPDAGSPGIA
ncbi:MAG TPA: hypothetical protein VFN57_03920 [Thermomicrobiaceae bacterium]|nr:hypothetical protein [Thermomicrobiaceae bacterium]